NISSKQRILVHNNLKSMKKLTSLIVFATLFLANNSFAQNVKEMIPKVMAAMGNAKTMTYHFYAQERMHDGKYSKSDVEFTVIASPLKIYANAHKPQSAQLFYDAAVSTDVKVKKGFKLNLSPTNSLLMKGVHNPVTRAGFGQIKKILETSMAQRKGEDLTTYVKVLGTVTYDNQECWKIEINDADYKIIDYTVAAGEKSVWQIGKKLAISEYKIKELNDIDDDVKPGQKLKIPSSYAKKTTLYIDKSNLLPIYHKMEDEKGIYEIYEFKDLKLGVNLTDANFQFK
ncbi:MAG TPA: LysM peptidoglycan-binding domain-containing protein, partial [Chitinophagales bacterium]|nr:LysM peptidoglycan-binding domain-containing protein [Chitinophagales bacterium]HMW12004.1 LysM peptidoglycan-binding domain-containing protein [Chitinophagales bacterium]HMZ33131.1 LysM peptidoglycan-binding domain-containing protein [Chitinophagales bacterium]HNA38527.1 LysM peptidoglycan-binding domain-containing protein [Chitinophagales bacterium]HNK12357.1 LysM peptidoglycan-binding domain-containing protein [Chitinophagales bacterium]